MGYKFALVLSRKITDEESATLTSAIRGNVGFSDARLLANAEVPVTKIEIDDPVALTLAEAIDVALEAVKAVPDLPIPKLSVPAQPLGSMEVDGADVVAAGDSAQPA